MEGNIGNKTTHWQHWVPVLERELAVEMQKAPSPSEVHAKDHILRVLKQCDQVKPVALGKDIIIFTTYAAAFCSTVPPIRSPVVNLDRFALIAAKHM